MLQQLEVIAVDPKGSPIAVNVPLNDAIKAAGLPDNPADLAAIREAFDEAKRRLKEAGDLRRGDVKSHEHALRGRVTKLFDYEGYGFIETDTGEEIYFHKNSVLNGAFERLERGARVRFIREEGDDGIHATSVALVR